MTGAGQVVVTQLGFEGPEGTQDATGTLLVLLVEQVVVIHGNATGVDGVHVETGVGPLVMAAGQVVSVQPLPELATDGVHDCTGTLLVLFAVQRVAV